MTEALPDDDDLAELFAGLALDAGAAIMRVYHGGNPNARLKKDASPVSDADILAEEVILKGLARALPHLPVVAEESSESGDLPKIDGGDFILVDALDGSKEFLNKRDSFTVNIALVRKGAPEVGVVFAPARSEVFLAGGKAWTFSAAPGGKVPPRGDWRVLHTRPMPERDAVAVASLSHRDPETDAFLTRLPVKDVVSTGSSREILPRRRRPGRRLPALRPNQGMGHRRRRRRSAPGRRRRGRSGRRDARLWQGGRQIPQRPLHRLGRSPGGGVLRRARGFKPRLIFGSSSLIKIGESAPTEPSP